jgi:hypothetical protein
MLLQRTLRCPSAVCSSPNLTIPKLSARPCAGWLPDSNHDDRCPTNVISLCGDRARNAGGSPAYMPHSERQGQIEIQNTQAFYDTRRPLDPTALAAGLPQREREALGAGYRGLRTNGNCSLIAQGHWTSFLDYESRVQQSIFGRRLICMCSYCHDRMEPATLGMIFERHDLVVHRPRANGHARPGPHVAPSPRSEFHEDVVAIQTISAVPTILEVVSNTTGMGFAAIPRVTPER